MYVFFITGKWQSNFTLTLRMLKPVMILFNEHNKPKYPWWRYFLINNTGRDMQLYVSVSDVLPMDYVDLGREFLNYCSRIGFH
jgi:hypothetical protein